MTDTCEVNPNLRALVGCLWADLSPPPPRGTTLSATRSIERDVIVLTVTRHAEDARGPVRTRVHREVALQDFRDGWGTPELAAYLNGIVTGLLQDLKEDA